MANLNYHHLRYFHGVVQAGGLTRAAEQMNVSPSALSVQLQQLEAQLGHPLFERRGRRLVLTEAGRIALDHAEAIFAAGDELVHTLRGFGGTSTRTVRVGAMATLSRNFQTEFLQPVLRDGDTRLVLRSGSLPELLQLLDAHHIDILLSNIVPPRDATTPWVPHLIAEQPISLVACAGRLSGGAVPLALLASEPLILPTIESSIRAEFDSLAERLGLRPRIVAEVDDMAMLRLLVRENIGLAVVPPIVVRDELAGGLLIDLGRLPGLSERFYAITPSRRFPNPILRRLLGSPVSDASVGPAARQGAAAASATT